MSFTGKATYTGGIAIPEVAEDVSDLVSIVSPAETPLLDALGDPMRMARSTVHEWLDDALLPNFDAVAGTITDAAEQATFEVAHAERFRPGDQVRLGDEQEILLVSAVDNVADTITVARSYGATTRGTLAAGKSLRILGNAALEGDAADAARFSVRTRKQNYTQIFTATVEVSGSELATRQIGVADEMNYQKQLRLRELLRDLGNCVINGTASAVTPAGSSTVRRTMNGLLSLIQTNVMVPGSGDFPADDSLTEAQLSEALRRIWMECGSSPDLILVNAANKRSINQFVSTSRRYQPADETFRDLVNVFESDFGVCRIVLSRYVPAGTLLLLDSSRIEVLPLAGRSFFYKPLATSGDRDAGQMIGEYTLELRNENAHGVIRGLVA